MNKHIVLLLLSGAVFLTLAPLASTQIITVTDDGQLPGMGFQNVKVYAIAMTSNYGPKIIWFRGLPNWTYDIFQSQLDSTGMGWDTRLVLNSSWDWASIWTEPDGRAFIRSMNVLLVEHDNDFMPVITDNYLGMDSLGIMHGFLETGPDIYYCLSRDTANTHDELIRLPNGNQFLGLRMAPDLGRYAMATQSNDSLFQYGGVAGQPLDTSTITIAPYGASTPEWAIDNDGRLFTLITLPGINDNFELYSWTSEYGLRWIANVQNREGTDKVFELAFCPSRDASIIVMTEVGWAAPESTAFIITLNRGDSWISSPIRLPGGNATCPVLVSDTLYIVNEYPDLLQVDLVRIPIDSILGGAIAVSEGNPGPSGFSMFNFPNPFNSKTVISFSLPNAGYVNLDIFDVQGRKVVNLIDGWRNAGQYDVTWDGMDAGGNYVSSGLYFNRLRIGGLGSETRKMLLLK